YPRWARERGYEGVVGVHFVIQPDGNVADIKVVRPCHCDILNKAACEAIKKAAPFNPRPDELMGKEMAMELDVGFRLE
ncbi:MAG: energy transducer TonB, partial [Deltaproteobacteria bacterium]|nr:energy transducer TonB [Deltaproteobacteria bacterium]